MFPNPGATDKLCFPILEQLLLTNFVGGGSSAELAIATQDSTLINHWLVVWWSHQLSPHFDKIESNIGSMKFQIIVKENLFWMWKNWLSKELCSRYALPYVCQTLSGVKYYIKCQMSSFSNVTIVIIMWESKHLKGHLAPRVSNVTFFNQRDIPGSLSVT